MSLAGIGAQLAALAEQPEPVACHACRLLNLWEGDDREGLRLALDTKKTPTQYVAGAEPISRAVRAAGETLPEIHVRLHRRDHR